MNPARAIALLALALLLRTPDIGAEPATIEPSRPAVEGCAWQHLADAAVGLAAWVQKCDFGFRQVDLFLRPGGLAIRYSDGAAADPVVDVFDRLPDETIEAGVRRVYAERTEPAVAKRCVLTPYADDKPAAGAQRYGFEPEPGYRKELAARADPNGVPEPPCGEYGTVADSIQYFEARPASPARKLLFVRAGQDEPLFDEQTLRPIAPAVPTDATASADAACCGYRTGPDGISADFLLETCSVTGKTAHGRIPYFDCQSYVLGVIDSYKALQQTLPTNRHLCLPPGMTANATLAAVATRYRHERDAQRRAAEVILDALHQVYACADPHAANRGVGD